jgi:hypothetical protein
LDDQVDNPRLIEILKELHRRIGFDVFEHISQALQGHINGANAIMGENNPHHLKETGLGHGALTCLIKRCRSEKIGDLRDPSRM